jgi:hypothetical protein
MITQFRVRGVGMVAHCAKSMVSLRFNRSGTYPQQLVLDISLFGSYVRTVAYSEMVYLE